MKSEILALEHRNIQGTGITGIVIELGYVDKVVFPELEGLKKKYFHSHGGGHPILPLSSKK